jgi:hypothetical protein
MSLTNVDGIRSREMVGLLIDFLTESRAGLVSLCSPRRMKAINDSQRTWSNVPKADEVHSFVLSAYPGGANRVVGRFDGVESGVKERQIRRPFHSDCDLPRTQNKLTGAEVGVSINVYFLGGGEEHELLITVARLNRRY